MAALTVQAARACRQQCGVLGSVYSAQQQHRHGSTVVRGQTSNLSAYKRGRGGRSSFSGIVATVFGASGFLGRVLVSKLGKIGSQVICPYRGDPYVMRELRLAGDLGQIYFLPFQLRDEESIRACMKHSNVVINLVGRDWETRNFKFKDVHVDGARNIARLARESGIERLIHVSHLSADPSPERILPFMKGGSNFLKSKYEGEMAVREEFPDATIMRPSDIYGYGDRFINYYLNPWRRSGSRIPLYNRGEDTIKMPVDVSDVAQGIVNAIRDPDAEGKVFECTGPHGYYLSDMVDYMFDVIRYPNYSRSQLTPGFLAKVLFMSYAPNYPVLNFEKLEKEFVSDNPQDLPDLQELGVNPISFSDRSYSFLRNYIRRRYFEEEVGQFAKPDPLQHIKRSSLDLS